jgi:N-methylhydantoinase B/oxoprolinase/acetone carboxylase alpha subunit
VSCASLAPTRPRRSGREHAVDDHTVAVQVGLEGGTETVDEGDRHEPLAHMSSTTMEAGDVFVIETPGWSGYGAVDSA